MVKYLVCPGTVISKSDGDEHFISAGQLMRLYGVKPTECVVMPTGSARRGWTEPAGLIHLRPSYHGNYELPKGS